MLACRWKSICIYHGGFVIMIYEIFNDLLIPWVEITWPPLLLLPHEIEMDNLYAFRLSSLSWYSLLASNYSQFLYQIIEVRRDFIVFRVPLVIKQQYHWLSQFCFQSLSQNSKQPFWHSFAYDDIWENIEISNIVIIFHWIKPLFLTARIIVARENNLKYLISWMEMHGVLWMTQHHTLPTKSFHKSIVWRIFREFLGRFSNF